jgi:hypothetical protein
MMPSRVMFRPAVHAAEKPCIIETRSEHVGGALVQASLEGFHRGPDLVEQR